MDDASAHYPSARPPGIYPLANSQGVLRYWDGQDWQGGPVASTWSRAFGNAVDAVMATVLALVIFVLFAIPVAIAYPDQTTGAANTGSTIALISGTVLGFVGYFAVCYRFWGRTLGMLLAGVCIVHVPSGRSRLPWGPAVVRSLILNAAYICGVVWIIWLIITGASKTKQGPHDLAAKTGVLNSRQAVSAASAPVIAATSTTTPPTNPIAPTTVPATPSAPAVVTDLSPSPSTAPADAPARNILGDGTATIFISHASQDGAVAQSLAAALEAQGIDTWLASRDVSIGANYAAVIFQNLVNSDYLLVVLSPHSIESAHVRREVSIAIDRKVPVLPVSTDPSGELMANLPEDWQYWLNIAQVFRMTDEASTAVEIARRVK